MTSSYKWWQTAVFYQIYPRSFADGNGDGIGDLKGMIGKLDYLKELGVDAVWLSPHFPSPNVDCGYDISDYQAVAPEYGTMEEFKEFMDGLHARGMHLVLDLVLNHTSDQHPWFIESRTSRENPKRDWYIWRKGKNGNSPNNWYSTFGGSAWEFDPMTDEYYYHFFFKEQPDLNWRNPEVKKAMFDAARFWLEMGVDGFRLDAVGTLFEEEACPDQPVKETQNELTRMEDEASSDKDKQYLKKAWENMFEYQHDLPEVHQVMRELRQVIDEYPDRVLIGETDDIAFYGTGSDELHLNFNFLLMRTKLMNAAHVHANQVERLSRLPKSAWPCNTLGNHDCSRMFNNYGDGIHNHQLARLNLMLLLTLKGTPFLYYGEELGMSDFVFADPTQFQDSLTKYLYRQYVDVLALDERTAAQRAASNGRDKCRTPMQWSAEANAGFSPERVKPWLPVNPTYANGVNLADQKKDDLSLWHYYQSLLAFRKTHSELQIGEYSEVSVKNEQVFAYDRCIEKRGLRIMLNFGDKDQSILPEKISSVAFFSGREPIEQSGKGFLLPAYTGIIGPADH